MRLKELREEKKISQKKLTDELKINTMTYCNWENENREPNIQMLCKLADYYNVSLDYLVGRDHGNQLGFLSNEQYTNIKLILSLNEKNQYKVFGYAMSLLENQ